MPFFDFHCHPALKILFTAKEQKVSPWQNIKATVDLSILSDIGINELFNEILNSQSSLTQLAGEVKLFGIALHAPESNMAVGLSAQPLVSQGVVSLLDKNQISYIAEGIYSFDLLNREIELLNTFNKSENAELIILNGRNTFSENVPQTIYAFLLIEGLHCFVNNPNDVAVQNQFINNFNVFTDRYKIFAVNLCHLQQNLFCNHAHGIQVFNDALFYPIGNGITQLGYKAIELITVKNILIDIKHTSLRSRRQLYSYLKDNNGNYLQPLICTHAGVTGLSINDRVKYMISEPELKEKVYMIEYAKPQSNFLQDTYYNCCSINLYNEDIVEILNSGGLIGLSLDQRILGFANENLLRGVTQPSDTEFISRAEAAFFLGPSPKNLPLYTSDENIWTTQDFENTDPSLNLQLHFRFFYNNVVHILHTAANNGILVQRAAKQICLGTDFDGLINTIDNCKNATELGLFKEESYRKLPALFQEAGMDKYGLDIMQFIEDLFYNNGKNFVVNRLNP